MIETLTLLAQFGIAGVAVYLMYDLSKQSLNGLKTTIEANTQAITSLREVVARLCEKLDS